MRRPLSISVLTLLVLAAAAAADAPKPLDFESLLLKADKLPADTKLVDGVHPASLQPNTFYEMPEMQGLLATPLHKAAQSLAKEGRRPGTVYLFEYESSAAVEHLSGFLTGLLYGTGERSREHPEEVVVHGAFLFILSFPMGDPAAEWYKQRLRVEFKIRAPCTDSPERLALGKKLYPFYEAGDVTAAKRLLAENEAMFADWVLGQFLLAETGMKADDGPFAEEHFLKALDLHESGKAIFDDEMHRWLCHDGVGIALLIQKKDAAALVAFEHAKDVGKEVGVTAECLAATDYNLACTQARLKKWDKALKALEAAIAGDQKWKERARTDEDLAEAVKRREFKALLAK